MRIVTIKQGVNQTNNNGIFVLLLIDSIENKQFLLLSFNVTKVLYRFNLGWMNN